MNEIIMAPELARAPMAAGRPIAIIPQTMDDAYRLGKAICLAGMAPKGMDSPEKCMIAIMRGMEVGLTPMQALDKIAIVNGRPTIWGDGALGLVRGSGICEYVKEWIEGDGDAMVAFCEAKRKGEDTPVVRSFSVKEAKEAGLWGKSGPWQQFKRRMLAMRARAFCLRDLFADVLGGLYLKEELDNGNAEEVSAQPPRRVAPSPSAPMIEHQVEVSDDRSARVSPKPPEKPTEPRRAPSPSSTHAPTQKPSAVTPYDPERVRARFAEALKTARSEDDLSEAWETIVGPFEDEMFPPDKEDIERMIRLREAELNGEEGAEP